MQLIVYTQRGGESDREKEKRMYSQARQTHRRMNRRIVSVSFIAAVLLSSVYRAERMSYSVQLANCFGTPHVL